MPVMDGFTAARRIRELKEPQKSLISIVALTASALLEDRNEAMEAGWMITYLNHLKWVNCITYYLNSWKYHLSNSFI